MGREKYAYDEDVQPPMCGGAVFSKFRPKPRERRDQHHNDELFKSFDQRPVMTESRSATSSSGSFDENRVSPETALLNENSRSKRGNKLFPFRSFMNTTSHDSSYENEDILRSEFLAEERGEEKVLQETGAVEFDPNELHKLRGKHLRSLSRQLTHPELSPIGKAPLPSISKPPKSPKSTRQETITSSFELNHSKSPKTYRGERGPELEYEHEQMQSSSNTEVVLQQQETLKIVSSQNQYYRKKLGDTERSYRKLVKNQMNQAEVIDKLTMEKETFQAETLLLREEMKAVRQQLELFQQILTQQSNTMVAVSGSPSLFVEASNGTTPKKLPTPVQITMQHADRSTMKNHQKPSLEAFNSASLPKNKNDQSRVNTVHSDPAENYWKREWELSMKGISHTDTDNNTTLKDANDPGDENSDPFFGIAKESAAVVAGATAVPTPRGVDPPEVKKTTTREAILTTKNLVRTETPTPTKKPEPMESKIAKKPSHDYEDDVKFVHELMEKYQKAGSHKETKKDPAISQFESDLDESLFNVDGPDTLIEIENMDDVDREYSQRQEAMARLRAAFERGELDDSIGEARKTEPQPTNSSYPHVSNYNQNGRVDVIQRQDDVEIDHNNSNSRPVAVDQKFLYEKVMPHLSEHEQSESGLPALQKYHPAAHPMMPVFLRGIRLQEPTVPDPSQHRNRSILTESRQDEPRQTKRSGNDSRRDVSHHSINTEYADQIDHSTSHHNTLMWCNSSHSEGGQAIRRECSMRKEHGNRSRPDAWPRNERSVSPSELMDGTEEERSEHTLAEVRDPGHNGRKGATYKIKMSSSSSHRYQQDSSSYSQGTSNRTSSHGQESPTQSRTHVSRRLI